MCQSHESALISCFVPLCLRDMQMIHAFLRLHCFILTISCDMGCRLSVDVCIRCSCAARSVVHSFYFLFSCLLRRSAILRHFSSRIQFYGLNVRTLLNSRHCSCNAICVHTCHINLIRFHLRAACMCVCVCTVQFTHDFKIYLWFR